MPTKTQLPQMEIRYCTMTMFQCSSENPALYRKRRSSILVCPACNMSSLAPCLHEEADTKCLLMLRKQLKGLKQENKQLRC